MAFLDNSGDIILDAVLTDTGRARLAKGDGSFKITKFAFADDEIDYSSYNGNHASGSAYYDLEILQTPVFEAFTNNTSTMKSKLLSLTNNNLLYLPILKLNDKYDDAKPTVDASNYGGNLHIVVADTVSVADVMDDNDGSLPIGISNGTGDQQKLIRIDQGLDTTEISADLSIDPELKETQYILEIDSRFGKIWDAVSSDVTPANPSFIDDDSIASYYITNTTGKYIRNSAKGNNDSTQGTVKNDAQKQHESIDGPRGTTLRFGIQSSTDLVSSNYLFTNIGGTLTNPGGGGNDYYYLDTTVRVTGVTTGYRIDIPVRFIKKQ